MKRKSRKEKLEEKIRQEIRKRVFDRSQSLEEQRRRLDEREAQLEALSEVSELPQREIETIARLVRREFALSQKERRRKIARMIRALVILAVAGGLLSFFLWSRQPKSPSKTDRALTDVRPARNEEERSLIEAAGKGNLQMLRFLLKKSVPVDVSDQDRSTPLMAAASAGHLEVVQFLLEQGADPLLRDLDVLSALDHAERAGHIPTVNLLARAVARASPADGGIRKLWERSIPFSRKGFIESARKNDTDAVRWFLEGGMDINSRGPSQKSALEAAAEKGNREVIELLLKADREPDVESINGALEAAAGKGYPEIEKLLLEARADK